MLFVQPIRWCRLDEKPTLWSRKQAWWSLLFVRAQAKLTLNCERNSEKMPKIGYLVGWHRDPHLQAPAEKLTQVYKPKSPSLIVRDGLRESKQKYGYRTGQVFTLGALGLATMQEHSKIQSVFQHHNVGERSRQSQSTQRPKLPSCQFLIHPALHTRHWRLLCQMMVKISIWLPC